MQILTRRLGVTSKASAMAVYLQGTFIAVSLIFWFVAGDGRYAERLENKSAIFLLRAWTWPREDDWPTFLLLGGVAAVVGYALSQAYRLADAATVAPLRIHCIAAVDLLGLGHIRPISGSLGAVWASR